MVRLDDLKLFIRTAALGSFSNAAREAGLLPGQASAAIKRLERALDIRLFARSTRSLRLTAEGQHYLPFACQALDALQEGHGQLHQARQALQGNLHLAAPSDLGRNLLLGWLGEFRRAYPGLSLRLFLSDQVTDVFRDPIDVAIRYAVKADASFIALPLAPANHRVLVASPAYLARAGRPENLEALAAHHCLLYVLGDGVYAKWRFYRGEGMRQDITVGGALISDDADVVRRWAVAGEGIACKSWLDVCADVQAGRLEVLLPHWRGEAVPLYLVCPHRQQFSPVVQALHQWLRECLAQLPAPPAQL
ncbi:LysR family transcriptional regulator [Pseudomonas sp. RIT-PI-S]|uniref:LysR family transcriptional regulator n=1 Tax=Pseudomonas sp. RIT-PI-S TaxID=3035295 RepID=UPI0021D9EA46|nr:LysR family transcriptional regulator [Pseudomonas sp. RIT-PI-S]